MSKTLVAHRIRALTAKRSRDPDYGLVGFERSRPMEDGEDTLWMAVPYKLMPYLAEKALQLLPHPSPEFNSNPAAFRAQNVRFGMDQSERCILTVGMDSSAAISYQLKRCQAEVLLTELRRALGDSDLRWPASRVS